MESAVEAVEGRLKSPVKKQGVICRTLLKALLMECFAWLPPGSFPDSSARLFKVPCRGKGTVGGSTCDAIFMSYFSWPNLRAPLT